MPQLASIERRQARIRRIRARRDALEKEDPTPNTPEQHHVIGKSQNFPEDITTFVRKNSDDPAAKVGDHTLSLSSRLTGNHD